jgi:cytochrome bd-type quinol oxidase subunit 1
MTALTAMMVLMSPWSSLLNPMVKKLFFHLDPGVWQAAVRTLALIGAHQLATAGAEQGTFSRVVPVHHGHPFRIA